MARLLKGAPVAAALDADTAKLAAALAEGGIVPTLAILRVGERADDLAYESAAVRRCERLGIAVRRFILSADASQRELMGKIAEINDDEGIHGALMFRPLPGHMDERAACEALLAQKDVDGISSKSAAAVYEGVGAGFAPCTAEAVIRLLEFYGVELNGKRAVILGRSLVIGRPAAMLLLHKNATVTLCHSRTLRLPEICREADILVAALGRAKAIGAEYLAPGQVVVDVGINEVDGAICGDVDFEAAEPVVAAISPVPAGVGSVTTAVLARHVVEAAGAALRDN